ncbi:Acyl dehydratase [Cupriavidus gilardii J11]|uniref:Acyl dehydratase n=1 Tax=Cupriavidus gilardii J11 TaxID=936133 RepID=A0A562BL32_9BURK|nr:MaoC/PaaZ C-terminal domain-containing protein [Cupriavidus gilardii]TWG85619.1 Acyl dehydratase [Cupriavidus gilardii J11]
MSAPDLRRLVDFQIPDQRQNYGARECILYALGLGLGDQPDSRSDLRYVYEKDLVPVPTQLAVLAASSDWMRDPRTGIRWEQLVALSHDLSLARPLPPSGGVRAKTWVEAVYDRGEGRGAIIHWTRVVSDEDSGDEIGTIRAQALALGNGGFGGEPPVRRPHPGLPRRQADFVAESNTHRNQALLYRLSGDMNPLHADPDIAREAGLDAPILHGLCGLGIAAVATGRTWSGGMSALQSIGGRYADVFYPGDTLRTEVWHEKGEALFRCSSLRTGRVVIDDGIARFFRDAAIPRAGGCR